MNQLEIVTDVAEAEFLAEKAGAIRALAKNVVRDVIEIGRHLSEVQGRLAQRGGAHKGEWLQWLSREFPNWKETSAYNIINVYRLASQFPNFEHWDAIDLSGIYKIAAPLTPIAARAEVLGRAEAGERRNNPYRNRQGCQNRPRRADLY